MKAVDMRIHQNVSGGCGVSEEGCRAMATRKGRLERINCRLVVTQVYSTKSEWPASAS